MDLLTIDDNITLTHDSGFDGWLTAVFVCYKQKCTDRATLVCRHEYIPKFFDTVVDVTTDPAKAERVLTKLTQTLGKDGIRQLMWAYLSELDYIPNVLFGVVKYALANPTKNILKDHAHPDVMALNQTVKSVGRERHRMKAFVRFEHTTDGVYFAKINPDFNVLPLITNHFKARYQDQDFAIYDIKRGYGILSRQGDTDVQMIVGIDDDVLTDSRSVWSDDEARYQRFWQGYFANVTIKERINPKLHKQYLPVRYWRYLSEKQVRGDEEFLKKKR
ncbi:TIGR03915 family putative DNA repair protein [Moraxella bovis]|uniref:TIGR03915 family putative DNA repair protein n=1 Tax=Moraxella bovis TaxID=476 RepID=UPI002226C9A7|nr:TIGR03915 family putative DNA repair protein [Moraxella bovis]UZA07669.1 TIGR03915 family putative DNA repair protein [Moraxella bovis]UZA34639.1 TIGR03915 family putative DNA repair protein [Moraxella bovis]